MIEEKTIIVPLTKSVDSVEAHAVDCSTCINVKDANVCILVIVCYVISHFDPFVLTYLRALMCCVCALPCPMLQQIPSQQEQDRAKSIVAAPLWDKGIASPQGLRVQIHHSSQFFWIARFIYFRDLR